MTPVDAITHHHHVFLKQAYAQGDHIKLHNDLRFVPFGKRYITFNVINNRFVVFKHTSVGERFVRSFDNIASAMLASRK
jgi:hypothetical protein